MEYFNTYKEYLKKRFGYSVYRIGVDAGFSCPNRDKNRHGGCIYCDELGSSASYVREEESGFTHSSHFLKDPLLKTSPFADLRAEKRLVSIAQQIERGKEFVTRRYKTTNYSLYFQAYSNTFAPISELKQIYDFALSKGNWKEFIISTRPDCTSNVVLDFICSYKDKVDDLWIELGLQSGSDRILTLMKRGHDVACYMESAKRIKAKGLKLCTHIIIGYPSETKEDLDLTIKAINDSGTDALKIHNLHITSQSALYNEFLEGEITTCSTSRHIQDTIYVLRRIRKDIIIQRLICETPEHRLASPRFFDDKSRFIRKLKAEMKTQNAYQGDLCKKQ